MKKLILKWNCRTCKRECIPICEESRCLCGHRYKEHPSTSADPRVKNKVNFREFACTSTKCACASFFYVVAEGAWILRCRCKHKHIDHDPSSKPFHCKKPKCSCSGFDSPWICNCDHPWTDHEQEIVEKEFRPLQLLQEQCEIEELSVVHRTDLFTEPLGL
uniref:Protein FAM221A n=1 Tax=Globisporangium ultimum (strain ATCC 200006 / CBS 805.95 / DAOM BR144) TaxID=431595 RepID=K3WRI4_GLOUD